MDNPEQKPRPTRPWYQIGTTATVSFASAIGLGVVGLAHSIRNHFYHSVIRGFNESPTVFTPIVEKYTNRTTGEFAQSFAKLERGEFTGPEHLANNRKLAKAFNDEIAVVMQDIYKIPTKGLEGWTVGSWKRFRELSTQGRMSSGLTFASLAATSVGAVFVLKHGIERMEDNAERNR